jgi:hypothetical protein
MGPHSPLNAWLVVLALSGTACHSMAHITQPSEPNPGTLEIRFNPSRNIDAVQPDGSRIPLTAVSRVRGSATLIQGDSISMQLHSWTADNPMGKNGQVGLIATLAASDAGISYYARRVSVKKSLLLAAVIVGAIALGVGQADVAHPGNIGGY